MRYTNTRYSTTLNDAQLDYLSDECQDICRMMCFKTFLRMAAVEPVKVSRKNFSADLQAGQFIASKVELAMLWKCNRKTATRIIREFNQIGILHSESSNRTTVHTLLCLSVWFTEHGMVRNRSFVSNPAVKPIEKPTRTTIYIPPKMMSETAETDKAVSADSGVTSFPDKERKTEATHSLISHADGMDEPMTAPFLSLSSGNSTHPNVCDSYFPPEATATDKPVRFDANPILDMTEDTAEQTSLIPCKQCRGLLREDTTRGKGNNDATESEKSHDGLTG